MVKPMDEVREERIKAHIARLKEIRDATLSGDDWEDWKPYIEAVTSRAFALGRLLDEDVVKVVRCKNCPHSKEWVEQAKQWTVWCEHFDMSTPRDWFCTLPVREREAKMDEVE